MTAESNVNSMIFNQMSENKYGTITPAEGEFYITPEADYALNTNVVHKTGDETITGTKTFINHCSFFQINDTASSVPFDIYQMGREDAIQKGLDSTFSNITFYNTSNEMVAILGGCQYGNINGNNYNGFRILMHDGNDWKTVITAGVDKVTKAYFIASSPSDAANSIVTNSSISKSSNGYVKYGNGIIAQWGYIAVAASTIADKSYTINLNTPFNSSNYYVNGTFKYTGATSNWGAGCPGVSAKSTSNFTIIADGINGSHPISGVYWFAYGY